MMRKTNEHLCHPELREGSGKKIYQSIEDPVEILRGAQDDKKRGRQTGIVLLAVCTAFFLPACIPEPVEIQVEQAESRLVVASQMLLNEAALIQVSRSFGALEFSEEAGDSLDEAFLDQILVDSARVTLTYRDGTDTLFNLGRGFYLSLGTPFYEGETYSLAVYDPATDLQVLAQTEVQPRTQWDSLDYDYFTETLMLFEETYTDTLLRLYAAFEDLPDENYYMLNAYRISLGANQNDDLFQFNSNTSTQIYADQLYSGSTIRDTINYSQFGPGDTVAFAISHISKGYYEYLSTRQRSGGSIFANLLQEPVNFPSNVEGGYGFFNLHLPDVVVRVLD
jgi:hypothetical protein